MQEDGNVILSYFSFLKLLILFCIGIVKHALLLGTISSLIVNKFGGEWGTMSYMRGTLYISHTGKTVARCTGRRFTLININVFGV